MPEDRTIRLRSVAALFAAVLAVGGCSTQIADMPGVGVPAGAPERPRDAGSYLPIHDLPPNREEEAIKPAELSKIQAELTAARDRQATASSQATPAKPAKK
ncbi:MAG: hypothetical protein C0480_23805 [Bradyrhizobium sp.]|jgi:hypothetical protein|nr:hypothetical protein [Bradyrhizobium sp.]